MLKDKVAIVTGAASGIGRDSARIFAHYGARLVLVDRNEAALEELSRSLGDIAFAVTADVSDEDQVERMVALALDRFGRIDCAFNNAGVETVNKQLHDITLADWRKVTSVDLDGVFLCMKHEIRAMLTSGKGGAIVNTASTLGQVAMRNGAEYVAAKHGVMGLTKAAALDYAGVGIRINAVLPGVIKTEIMTRLASDPKVAAMLDVMRMQHPLERFGEPSEIAQAAAWLLSDKASFITGTGLAADGGFQAQ
jgi:NAD(P)-dependent dehydrogenase (short-subunit alcohol dehydrogenase family)